MALNCLVIGETLHTHLQPMLATDDRVGYVFAVVHPYQLQAAVKSHSIDIVFVRVKDWNDSLIKGLYHLELVPPIVFVSLANDNYVKDLVAQVDFHLHEPLSKDELTEVISNAVKMGMQKVTAVDFLFLKYRRKTYRVAYDDIELVERVRDNRVMVYTRDAAYELWSTLGVMLERLPEDRFRLEGTNVLIRVQDAGNINDGVLTYRDRKIKVRRNTRGGKTVKAKVMMEEVIG